MKRKPFILLLGLAATAAILLLSLTSAFRTTQAQTWNADKAVTNVTLGLGNSYPAAGTPITGPISFTIGGPQTMISVTSNDLLQSLDPGGPPLDSIVGFYADIPATCSGRWWDPNGHFPADTYTRNGQPTAEPLSPMQLGTPVPAPPAKAPGDTDSNPVPPGPGLPVPGETFEVDLHFQTSQYGIIEPVGIPTPITRFFDFHCEAPGTYVFWICNKIEPRPPYTDPDFPVGIWPGDNVLCAPLTVQAAKPVGGVAEAPDVVQPGATVAQSAGGSSGGTYAVIAGIAAAIVVLGSGGRYARRRLTK